MPSVSVIIPAYGHRDFLMQTLESVFAQSYTDYEVIVVNDGSPDDTETLLAHLVREGRIQYVKQDNRGQAIARNRGLSMASGRYIALLDDDDLWPADKLSWQVEELSRQPEAVMVYGQHLQLGKSPAKIFPGEFAPDGSAFDAFVDAGWIRSPGQTLIRAEVLRDIGGFDAAIWGTDDWDLWLRLAKAGAFIYRPRVALHYRMHQTNASRRFHRMYRNGLRVVHKHFGVIPSRKTWGNWVRAQKFVRGFAGSDGLIEARRLAVDGRVFAALWTLLTALTIWPVLLKQKSSWTQIGGMMDALLHRRGRKVELPCDDSLTLTRKAQ